ncbi:hypothetical protein Q31b_44280 [Novipirellula aureliae]|uniref:Uncharacterized protein n=1 Tax=Novipirellula aureliae TaxID=2527966 RepID=A0A5C6DLE9_9BACT|nr:hypothetical protein Q31b_44280 [Novipirellula aureliae]
MSVQTSFIANIQLQMQDRLSELLRRSDVHAVADVVESFGESLPAESLDDFRDERFEWRRITGARSTGENRPLTRYD